MKIFALTLAICALFCTAALYSPSGFGGMAPASTNVYASLDSYGSSSHVVTSTSSQ